MLLQSGYFFRYSKEGTNAVVFDANPRRPLTVSGFVWEGNTERLLKGTYYIIDESMGGGRHVLRHIRRSEPARSVQIALPEITRASCAVL